MSVAFGNIPVVAPFGKQEGISVSGPSVVLPISPIEFSAVGAGFACGFGAATSSMPGKLGFDFRFGNVPLVMPAGLQI